MLRKAGLPCLEVGNLVRNPIDMAVGFSNHDAGRTMTGYLDRAGLPADRLHQPAG